MYTAVVTSPDVRLSGSGSRVAGTSYALTCTVIPPTGVQFSDPPTIQWPELNIRKQPQISSGVYVTTVTLNPLKETHSGQYSCSASYSLGSISSEVVTDKLTVTVICKLIISIPLSSSYLCFVSMSITMHSFGETS